MSELALNLMVGAVAINAIITARTTVENRRERVRQHGPAMAVYFLVAMLVILGLWVWIGLSSGHWQFIAMAAIPVFVTVGSVATKSTNGATA